MYKRVSFCFRSTLFKITEKEETFSNICLHNHLEQMACLPVWNHTALIIISLKSWLLWDVCFLQEATGNLTLSPVSQHALASVTVSSLGLSRGRSLFLSMLVMKVQLNCYHYIQTWAERKPPGPTWLRKKEQKNLHQQMYYQRGFRKKPILYFLFNHICFDTALNIW